MSEFETRGKDGEFFKASHDQWFPGHILFSLTDGYDGFNGSLTPAKARELAEALSKLADESDELFTPSAPAEDG